MALLRTQPIDVLVVGSGNAGFSAAIAASEAGASRVVLIEKSSEDWVGGNTYFTAGAFRIVHDGARDLIPLVNNVDAETAKLVDVDPYTAEDFRKDFDRICAGRSDPALSQALIDDSNAAVKWLARNGIRFQLSFNRQAYKVNGRYKFWGGLHIKTEDLGQGLIADHQAAARRRGIEVYYSTPAKRIMTSPLRRCHWHRSRTQRPRHNPRNQSHHSRRRRLRSQPPHARTISRPNMGSRTRARHTTQHRRSA